MRLELLEFKRCCCCLPLRYGILIWGYWKLIVSMLMFITVTVHIISYTSMLLNDAYADEVQSNTVALVLLGIFMLVISIDVALTVVLVVGGHKKSPRLLKVYQYYSIGMLVLYILGFTLSSTLEVISYGRNYGPLGMALSIRSNIVVGIINIGLQGYLILVNRSEILKLENNRQFQFVNNAERAECIMNQGCTSTYIQNSEPVYEEEHEVQEAAEVKNEIVGVEERRGKSGSYARL